MFALEIPHLRISPLRIRQENFSAKMKWCTKTCASTDTHSFYL